MASPDELRAIARRRRLAWRHVKLPAARRFAPSGYALLAACRPGERTVEEPALDGKQGGVFTRSLLRVLEDLPRDGTFGQLLSCVTLEVRSRFPAQTPVIEGEGDRVWMAGRHRPRLPGVEILGRGWSAGSVRLATGAVHGVAEGAVLAVGWSASAGTFRGPELPRMLRVTAAGAASSESKVTGWPACSPVEPPRAGDRAVPIDLGPRAARCDVALPAPNDGSPGTDKLLDRLREELSQRTIWVRPADSVSAPFAVVIVGEHFVVQDRRGRRLPWTGRPLAISDQDSIAALVRRLDHLGRWEWTRRLKNRAPGAALAGRIGAGLRQLPEGWQPGWDQELSADDDRPALDRLAVRVGSWVLLEIINRSAQELNIAVLDLRPDWSIVQTVPGWYGGRFQPLDPGRRWPVPLRASLPAEMDCGEDILLILATSDPASHRWLELPALKARADGGSAPGAVSLPAPPPGSAEAESVAAEEWIDDDGVDGWVTARVELEVRRGLGTINREARFPERGGIR